MPNTNLGLSLIFWPLSMKSMKSMKKNFPLTTRKGRNSILCIRSYIGERIYEYLF